MRTNIRKLVSFKKGKVERLSANFVQEDCNLPLVKKDVVFALVADIRGKALSHNAVPVWPINFIKFGFDMLGNLVFHLQVFNCPFCLN